MRALLGAALLLVSCKNPAPTQQQPTSAASVVTVPPPAPSASAQGTGSGELEKGQVASSVAVFKKDQLVACIDSVWVFPQLQELSLKSGKSPQELLDEDVVGFVDGADTLIGDVLVKSASKDTAAALRPSGKGQALTQICGKQFPGRVVVASCLLGVGTKARIGIEIRSFDAITDNDRLMRGCLAAKGNWQEMPADSRDFKREELKQRLRDLQHTQ